MDLPPITAVFAGIAGMAGFAYYLSHLSDEALSVDAKERIAHKLRRISISSGFRRAFLSFLDAADRWYGPKLFSARAVSRSCILSVFWTTLVLGFLALANGFFLERKHVLWKLSNTPEYLFALVLVVDYASATGSRWLVRWSLGRGPRVVLLLPVADLVFSVALFLVTVPTALVLRVHNLDELGYQSRAELALKASFNARMTDYPIGHFRSATRTMPDGLTEPIEIKDVIFFPVAVFMYSSLLTSFWLWLYVLSYMLLFIAVRTDREWKRPAPWLNLDEKPTHTIAFLLLMIASVVGLIVATALATIR